MSAKHSLYAILTLIYLLFLVLLVVIIIFKNSVKILIFNR